MSCVIWWIRRDLRLGDNHALHTALASGATVVPVFIMDPHRLQFPAAKRQAFLMAGLRQLDASLRERGSRLIIRQGNPLDELRALCYATQATAIFAEEAYSPYARRRDADVAGQLPLRLMPGLTVQHPATLVKANGTPYTTFGPFMRAWKSRSLPTPADLLPMPARLPAVPPDLLSRELPDANPPAGFPAGEREAQRRLQAFTDGPQAGIHAYHNRRNVLVDGATSELSPYLRFGMISPRQAVIAAHRVQSFAGDGHASSGADAWLDELIWREFYHALLFHFPETMQEALRADRRSIAWINNEDDFTAWCDGRTGYPIVDAAMRQLVYTGWLPNRARLIVASFLVKDLLVDWRWGARRFMEHLIDGDAAANTGGWQWTAGTGGDAAPYFRVFNPILQAQTFDPGGLYIRRWLPELQRVPKRFIHKPWTMPVDVQREANCIIGHDYPAPIIDHEMARQRALAAYRRVEGQGSSQG